jgi:hypothetical protein
MTMHMSRNCYFWNDDYVNVEKRNTKKTQLESLKNRELFSKLELASLLAHPLPLVAIN